MPNIEIAEYAIHLATKLGARYSDARLDNSRTEMILVKDGKVEKVRFEGISGIGVRVLLKTWGFASTTDLTKQSVRNAVRVATKMARTTTFKREIKLANIEAATAKSHTKVKIDPFKLGLEEKIDLCIEADSKARVDESIRKTSASTASTQTEKIFISSEGAHIEQTNTLTYADVFALAKIGSVTEYYEDTAGGSGGFEIVKKFDMVAKGENVGKKAVELAHAKTLPKLKLRVVLDQDFVSLLTHEIIGHPSEADRILGREAAWAGRAWWVGKLGQRIGSKLLNATDYPKVTGALGYFEYDDEGMPAKRKTLIKEGVLTEHMHSRETAAEFATSPNGSMRATDFRYLPLIRMSNTFIEPGDFKCEELFEVSRGAYLKGAKIPSIDSRRYNFQISAKEAFLIEKGELKGPFRDVSLIGVAPKFFTHIDAVADDFEMRPIPNCGKGDPMQTLNVGNGGPHLRSVGIVAGAR